jgi:hypothetical protein
MDKLLALRPMQAASCTMVAVDSWGGGVGGRSADMLN